MLRNLFILLISSYKIIPITFFIALVALVMSTGCTSPDKQSNKTPDIQSTKTLIPETEGSKGFLSMDEIPDSIALLPPPPDDNSTAFELDKELSRDNFSLQGSPRWDLATEHLSLNFPEVTNAFYCSLNAQITKQDTPHLYALLRRTYDDVAFTDDAVKHEYKRPHPFVVNDEPKCTERKIRKYTSYPSGGAALVWAWALILSEIAPEKSDDILTRGRAIGQSFVVCNVAWQSDVTQGRILGSMVVARLHGLPEFQASVKAAKSELALVRAKNLPPIRDCDAENALLL